MADYCKQCSIQTFGSDYQELARLCDPGDTTQALCEGCGPLERWGVWVDHTGKCVDELCTKHGEAARASTVTYKRTLDL